MLSQRLRLSGWSHCGATSTRHFSTNSFSIRTALSSYRASSLRPAPYRLLHASAQSHEPTKKQVVKESADVDEVVIKTPKKKATPKKAGSTTAKATATRTTKTKATAKPPKAKPATKKASPAKKAAPKSKAKAKRTSTVKLPKQVRSTWMLYFNDQMPSLRAQIPEGERFSAATAAKQAGETYRALSSAEKADLEDRLVDIKKQYKLDLEEAMASLTPSQIKEENAVRHAKRKSGSSKRRNLIDPNKPKRPMTAFFIYLDEKRADAEWVSQVKTDVASTDPKISKASGKPLPVHSVELTALSTKAGHEWRAMSEEEKKPYNDQAQTSSASYKQAMKEYAPS